MYTDTYTSGSVFTFVPDEELTEKLGLSSTMSNDNISETFDNSSENEQIGKRKSLERANEEPELSSNSHEKKFRYLESAQSVFPKVGSCYRYSYYK